MEKRSYLSNVNQTFWFQNPYRSPLLRGCFKHLQATPAKVADREAQDCAHEAYPVLR